VLIFGNQVQRKMAKALKIRASKLPYQSVNQLTLAGFESPFSQKLSSTNRWVLLSNKIPWDQIVGVYDKQMRNGSTGASHINARVVLGALMIKHMCNLSDEETILQIQENMYMQYFIGYSSFSDQAPFDASLFVEIRKRLGIEQLAAINEQIVKLSTKVDKDNDGNEYKKLSSQQPSKEVPGVPEEHFGRLLVDATACPQDIAYPTDLNILNDAREKSEQIIDVLFNNLIHPFKKPRTYREKARKIYLRTAQKKNKSKNAIRNTIGKQLRFLKRNISHINMLLDGYDFIPLDKRLYKYLLVIQETYRQQKQMWENKIHTVPHRIVSIHQPHVRPIVRGKERAKTEFGCKINVSLVKGYTFIDQLSWDAFNEGTFLKESIEKYKARTGYYPKEVLADKIYCNRENRKYLKELGIHLKAKPLGRPSAVNKEHVRPGERNPIEGKFGQAKTAYGLDRIKARLNRTSESWVASIILVLNLVKLAGEVPFYLIRKILFFLHRISTIKKSERLLFQ